MAAQEPCICDSERRGLCRLSQGQDKAGPRNRRARRRTAAAVAPARSAKNLGDEFPAAGRTIRDDRSGAQPRQRLARRGGWRLSTPRSEEHTSELQSLMRISYAVFCLKKKKQNKKNTIE